MSALRWQSFQLPDVDEEYVVVLAQYAWAGHLALPSRLALRTRLQEHLRAAEGLLGYSVWTALRRKCFYLLMVWANERARSNFGDPLPVETVEPEAHRTRKHQPTWALEWRIPSDLYPPTWHEPFRCSLT